MAKWQTVSFNASKVEMRTIQSIAERAAAMALSHNKTYPVVDAAMDITAAHANGCPLRLDDLLAAEPFDFAHDVFGIRRHLNRMTGKLENCFRPRFAATRPVPADFL
jgi:hypothetical protein